MKKKTGRWMALCLTAAVLGGCGTDGGAGTRLEDMGVPLSEVWEDGPEGAGEGQSGVGTWGEDGGDGAARGDNGGGDAGQSASSQAMPPEKKAMYEAYVKVLEDIYFDGTFPGGADYGNQPEGYDVSENMFAVWDIDFDGREELIVSYIATYTAGMVEIVYDYDGSTGSVREEIQAYPYLTYYDNGVVEEMASHNHGMASDGGADGNFWPYSLRRYDPQTDAYVPVGSVDAWSRGFREEDYDGNPFPEEADIDGDGVVYYVMEGDYYLENPKDGAEYNQWRDSYLKGAKPVKVPYVNLTTDNIYGIKNGTAVTGGDASGEGSGAGRAAISGEHAGKQIVEQSFPVTLDGWGEVTFAPFAPEGALEDGRGQACFGDVRFALLKEGETILILPGENEDNVFYGQQFGQVLSVAFRDYNEDGRTDILVLLEYNGVQGSGIDIPFRTVRAYTQEEGEKVFSLDRPVSEYLDSYTDSMERVYEGLADYAGIYAVATGKSAWEVDRFARKVKRLILAGDFQGLCGEIAFPITVDGKAYQDKDAFLEAAFINDVNPDFLEALRTEPCGNMFVNYEGVMLGDGSVWISEILDGSLVSQGLKVYGMNGLDK